jgi:phosphoesterase RecJ-like protein
MTLSIEQQIVKQLLRSNHILILPSAPADGDCLGSALSLYKVLQKLGKKTTVITAEPVPKDLKFLPLIEKIAGEFNDGGEFIITVDATVTEVRHEVMPGKVNLILTPASGTKIARENVSFGRGVDDYDVIVTVDTGDLVQLGKFYEENTDLFHTIPVINIDHHASNGEFGTINHIDITASATTQMLVPLIKAFEIESGKELMDPDIATLLLAGIITDTGSFQHSNTTPKAFSVSSQLLDWGARQQEIIKHVFKTKSLATLKLWGQVLSKIKFSKDYRFVWSTVSKQDLEETGADMEDTGAIIDELLNNAPGAEVVALIKEKDGAVSCSLRTTTNEVDASKLAQMFDGGGHVRAAGCRIKGLPFDQAVTKFVNTILEQQANRLNLPIPHSATVMHEKEQQEQHQPSSGIRVQDPHGGPDAYEFED